MPNHPANGSVVGYTDCPVCGQMFFVTSSEWVYKRILRDKKRNYIKTLYYCKWSCYRADEKKQEEQKEKRKQEAIERRTKKLNATLHERRLDKSRADSTQ